MFISNAFAEAAATPSSPGLIEFLPLVGLAAVFYFFDSATATEARKGTKNHVGRATKRR